MRAARYIITYEAIAKAAGLLPDEIIGIAPQTAEEIAGGLLSVVVSGDDLPKHIEGQALLVIRP